jgi:GGDEF domain-containing protein
MHPKRFLRAGTPVEVSALVLVALILGTGCLSFTALPMADDAPLGLLVGVGIGGLATALALVLVGPRARPLHLHTTVVLVVVLLAVMVAAAATERGLMMSSLGYIWMAVYVAYFFTPRVARAYGVGMIVVFGAGLLLAQAPTDASVWIVISTMVWVALSILSKLNERLRAEAQNDSLTGLLNRAGFAQAAARQRAIAVRRGEALALVAIDLDDFKIVNDRHGHAAGDRLLVELAHAWTGSLRPTDLLARYGGDEFVLLLPGASEEQVDDLLARLTRSHPFPWTAGSVICTSTETLDEALDRADARLYEAKRLSRAAARLDVHPSVFAALQPGTA